MNDDFSRKFWALTGNKPLSWQTRLYEKHFVRGDLPSVIDIATGLGKTMVMAIWLIARARHPGKVPTRLIYVVDRRTVVDQATDLAVKLRDNCKQALDIEPPAISTLRGHLADNREWSRDPSRPAIIIGTVDLIGSALLFSGYRSSYKRRPLEAGLVGQDSLLVLDEAHLSKPFEKLLKSIESFEDNRGTRVLPVKPMRIIRMSATSGNSRESQPPFTLRFDANGNLMGDDAKDTTITDRFHAKKRLAVMALGEKEKLTDRLAREATKLAENDSLRGTRIVVFVRKPDDAQTVAQKIRDHVMESVDERGPKPKKVKNTPYVDAVEVLTGTMRGLERDKLVEKPVLKRFLDGDENPCDCPNQRPVFLISTSAGEVGFDLNADHLVGDEAPLDSWIQRLGRVNRRGKGEATVILTREEKSAYKADFDKACTAATNLLTDGMDVSPKGIATWKESLWSKYFPQTLELSVLVTDEKGWIEHCQRQCISKVLELACTPKPTMVELTDILLDNWSMTSITERMPGRPEVGPWLRGIDDELPQTTIAWRAELDEPGFADLAIEDIEEWFDTHRTLTHETLSVPTSDAAKWLMDRWNKLDDKLKSDVSRRSIIVNRSGLKRGTVKEIVDQLARKNIDSIRYAEIILPASFGGIERGIGLLDAAAPKKPEDVASADEQTRWDNARARLVAPDIADLVDRLQRQREIVSKTEDGEPEEHRIIGGGTTPPNPAHFRIELTTDDDCTVRLVSHVPKREKLEYGSEKQTLQQHVGKVRIAIDGILSRLSLPDDFKRAAQLAADWHDHGKNRARWQRTIGGTATVGTTDWMQQNELERDDKHQCLGKSGGNMKRDSRGYRHEFGSLREFADSMKDKISDDVFDLAMHLIATHHGRGRPHFSKGGFDPDCEPRSDEIHTESIRRFARLQRKYGWWGLAWLENLLRCADQLASADEEVTEIDELAGDDA